MSHPQEPLPAPIPRRPCALVLSYHYPPSGAIASRRLGVIVSLLRDAGLEVLVVSRFGDSPIAFGNEIAPGVWAFRVADPPKILLNTLVVLKRWLSHTLKDRREPTPPPNPAPAPSSALRSLLRPVRTAIFALVLALDPHKRWSLHAYRVAFSAARNHNVQIVVTSGPPFSAVLAGTLVARRLNKPHLLDVRDPLVAGWCDPLPRIRLATWFYGHIEAWMIRRAAKLTCASPGIVQALTDAFPESASKFELVMNGFDGAIRPAPSTTNHRLDILYAGSLYVGRNPFPFLEALETLLQEPGIDASRITVRFIGHCESFRDHRLADWLRGRRSEAIVEVRPPVSEAELLPLAEQATVLLNLAQGQQNQVPAKTFEHLASGREVLALCEADSDTGRLLDSVTGAIRIEPNDSAGLVNALRGLYRRHVIEGIPRALPIEQVQGYSRQSQNKRFINALNSAMHQQRPHHLDHGKPLP